MDSPDLTAGLVQMFSDFQAGWFLGTTTLCYLLINVLRGKAGFVIPYVTPWLEKQNREYKTYVIIIFFALSGFFASFGAQKVTVLAVLNGLLEGLSIGMGTIGARNTIKQGLEGWQTYKAKNKSGDSNTDQNGSTT